MKPVLLISILFIVTFPVVAQPAQKMIKDTARTPIEGTTFKAGKIFIAAGYQMSLSRDKKIATISKRPSNIVKGSYSCYCATANCSISTSGAALFCSGGVCCQMISTTRKIDFSSPETSAEDLEYTRWKFLVIPQ